MSRRSIADMSLEMSGYSKKPINLSSIAKKLGISISTVSRALRSSTGTHPATRQRIIETAEEMGYLSEANPIEKIEKTRRIMVLSIARGAVIDIGYLSGISRAALTFNLSLLSHHYNPEDVERAFHDGHQPPAIKSGELEGVILIHRWAEQILSKLKQRYPIVSIVHNYAGVAAVSLDDLEGMEVLIQHLASYGHTKIGFLGQCPEMTWARSRYASFVGAVSSRALLHRPEWAIPLSLQEALEEEVILKFGAADRVKQLVKEGVTGWICSSDSIGYSLVQGLMGKGMKIPEQVSVAGFHTFSRNPYGLPPLTSVKCPPEDLGEAAVHCLVSRIEHPEIRPYRLLLPCILASGETTGPI